MSIPSLSLEGKVAIVTGARRGIGKAIALRFAEAGADVAICDYVAGSELDSAAKEIKKTGQRSLAVQVDVRDVASINNLVKQVHDTLGDVHILANVAGTAALGPLVDLPEEEWDRVLDTNLKGYYLMCRALGKRMIELRRGCIINIASVDAFIPIPYQSAYNSSKAGIVMLTNTLAFELGKYQVRVNAIAPGLVKTPLTKQYYDSDALWKAMEANIALGRVGKPIDIANVALFLASDLADWVTGATWRVDGGWNPPTLSSWEEQVPTG